MVWFGGGGCGFYFCLFLVWKNKHFYRARKLVSRKGSPGVAADGPMCPCWVSFFSRTVRGDMVFRGEGWSAWRKEMSLGTEDPGSPIAFPAICSEMWPCLESLPSSDRRARHPASIFPSTGAKNHKGKEENLYIYNIKSLGD